MFAEYIQIEETTALSVAEYETQQKEKEQAVQQVSQAGASMSASDSELALLAAIIQCEAGGERPHRKSCRRGGYHEPGKKQSVSEQHYRSCLPEWAVFSGSQRNPFFCIEPGSKK